MKKGKLFRTLTNDNLYNDSIHQKVTFNDLEKYKDYRLNERKIKAYNYLINLKKNIVPKLNLYFEKFTNLKIINLHDIGLDVLPKFSIEAKRKIEILNFGHNPELGELFNDPKNKNYFEGFESLRRIDLDTIGLTKLPNFYQAKKTLEFIDLESNLEFSNKIENDISQFKGFKKLKKVVLTNIDNRIKDKLNDKYKFIFFEFKDDIKDFDYFKNKKRQDKCMNIILRII